MRMDDLLKIDRDYLLPTEVATYLHVHPQALRKKIREDNNFLGTRAIVIGKMIKIPKIPFLRYMGMDV